MEKLREINEGNAEIKNVYFGFENLFPTKNKNISDISKKGKKGKKSKSKSKEKIQKNKNSFNQTYPIKNYNEFDNSNYKVKGSKYIQKPVKIIKTDEEREQEYFEEKNKKKKNSKKKKSKSKSKNKIKEKEVTENEENELIEVNNKNDKNITKKKVKEEENSENEENGNKKIKKKKKKAVNEEEEEIIENEKNNKSKSKTKKKNKTKEEEPKIIKEEQKENKIKKEKKNKSKEKIEGREINEDENHEEIIIISNIKATKNKEKSTEKKNKNKTKKKRVKKKEEREIPDSDDNDKDNDNETQSENNEKKKKKKSKTKSKDKSKSKSKSKTKTKTQKSDNTEEVMENNRTQIKIKKLNKMIDEGTDMEPEYNEIKDDAMNFVDKHIQNLSLTVNDNKLKNNKNNKNKSFKTINKNNKNSTNNNFNFNFDLNDTLLKRPYTAHGYKAKSKTKRQIKTSRPINEEEKIMAFKEKVLVHDKVLSLFNNNLFQKNLKDEFTQTKKPKKSNSKHYMMPKKKDMIKQNKIKKKEIIYYNDKPEEDPDEIKPNEEDENKIKNKNSNAIKLMTSSKKYFSKSNQALNDIDKILTKKNMDTFINNFMCKNNINLDLEEEKTKTNYENNQYPYVDISKIKYYHGGKTYFRPKSTNRQNPVNNNANKLNNSDINLKSYNNRHIFNPNEIISNPNNKFNFFSQTFTKQPIYGKYYNPPEVEDTFNNNLSYIESNKWNGRYKLKKYTYEEKENPNDVYNYDYKYDDLNDDSDNELPSTNFKARTLPKYKKIDIEYKDNKTGKIVSEKNDNKIDNKLFQDNGDFDKAIYHPFLIDDDTVNI